MQFRSATFCIGLLLLLLTGFSQKSQSKQSISTASTVGRISSLSVASWELAMDTPSSVSVVTPASTATTTQPVQPSTTVAPRVTETTRANRGTKRSSAVLSNSTPPSSSTSEEKNETAFWRRLADCESQSGTGGNGGGYFQFSVDTAAKVGYHSGQSYGTQLAEAKDWGRRIHPREGSKSGWPHCWWVALNG